MNKNRIIYDLNTPCSERRPTTKGDIVDDTHVKDYESARELFDGLIDLFNENKEEVYSYLVDQGIVFDCALGSFQDDLDYDSEEGVSDEDVITAFFDKLKDESAVNLIEAFLNDYCHMPDDWGDGDINLLYVCANGEELEDIEPYDSLTGLDLNTATEKEVVEARLKNDDYEHDDEDEDDDEDDENFDLNSFANKMGDWVRDTIKHGGFEGFKTKNDIVARLINLMASDLVDEGYDLKPYLADLID